MENLKDITVKTPLVGEVGVYKGVKYLAVEWASCRGCHFDGGPGACRDEAVMCAGSKPPRSVIYKPVGK